MARSMLRVNRAQNNLRLSKRQRFIGMRKYLTAALVAASALAVVPAGASIVTSQGALAPDDSIIWSQLGAPFTVLNGSQNVTSVLGKSAVVSSVGDSFERRDQGNGWNGNFAPGDALLWDGNVGPDITITFANPVSGVGAQIQADMFGAFTAEIHLSNGDVISEDGDSNTNADGSAIFLGTLDTTADILSISFDLTAAAGNLNDFALDTLFIRTDPLTQSVPEPITLSLIGAGLAGAVAIRRRRKKSV